MTVQIRPLRAPQTTRPASRAPPTTLLRMRRCQQPMICSGRAIKLHEPAHSQEHRSMSQSNRKLHRSAVGILGLAALVGAFGLGAVVAQQQTPATKVTALMNQVIAEYPGH